MTILFFAKRFYPYVGGVEKHVLEISKKLTVKSYKVIVISEKVDKTYSNHKHLNLESARFAGRPIEIESYKIDAGKDDWFKKFRIWKQLWRYKKLIKNADVVHCHDVFFWYLPFRFIFPKKPVFTTFHGYEGNNLPSNKAIFMHKLAEKLSRGNICVGDFLSKWYGTKPTYVTYGAIDSDLISQGQILHKPDRDIMFLGRLEEDTGIMDYLKTLKILKGKNINLTMDIFGDGNLKEKARKYAKENKLSVGFKGFVPNADRYLKDYKYIFTSGYLGILEAMAVKKPVFSLYGNIMKKDYLEMAPFSEFISISKNAEEVGKNLEKYMEDRNSINIQKAYDWVKIQTWENMVKIYLKLWS